jgi:hypothetical protein
MSDDQPESGDENMSESSDFDESAVSAMECE